MEYKVIIIGSITSPVMRFIPNANPIAIPISTDNSNAKLKAFDVSIKCGIKLGSLSCSNKYLIDTTGPGNTYAPINKVASSHNMNIPISNSKPSYLVFIIILFLFIPRPLLLDAGIFFVLNYAVSNLMCLQKLTTIPLSHTLYHYQNYYKQMQ